MTYPERKLNLLLETLAYPINDRACAHDGLLAYTGACTDSARLGGYRYIQKNTECRAPILLAQAQVDGQCIALFEISE